MLQSTIRVFRGSILLPAVFLPACSSPGPLPTEFAQQEPEGTDLDAPTRAQLRRETQAALDDVRDGRFDRASERIERVLARDPRSARAHAIRGRCLAEEAQANDPVRVESMERAEGEILLARRLDAEDVQIVLLHAGFLELDGQVTLAAKVLDEAVAMAPNNRLALREASRLRFDLGEERAAISLLERLLAASPEDEVALYRLAQCQVRMAEAVVRGDTAPEPEPEKDAARNGFLTAAATFQKLGALTPADAAPPLGEVHARFQAANLLPPTDAVAAEREISALLPILDAVQKKHPAAAEPLHSRAVLLERLGQPAEARTSYEAALRIDENFVPAILNMAALLDAAGDSVGARTYCLRALALDVDSTERRRLQRYLDGKD